MVEEKTEKRCGMFSITHNTRAKLRVVAEKNVKRNEDEEMKAQKPLFTMRKYHGKLCFNYAGGKFSR